MTPGSARIDTDVLRIEQALAAGAPSELVVWERCGLAGPGWSSDQLTLRETGGILVASFKRTRWDEITPPYRTRGTTVTFAKIRGIEKLARVLYGRKHAEETDPCVFGGTKITITLRALGPGSGGPPRGEVAKTFHQQLPAELAALHKRVREMIDACAAKLDGGG